MKKNIEPLIFFGTEDFSCASLKALIEDGRSISHVITKPDSKRGRGQQLTLPSVKILAEKAGLKVLQPKDVASLVTELSDLKWGVLSAYGQIIPPQIIKFFSGGIINIHPSLLPAYRGASPIETAIINGDQKTGVSLMQLVDRMDAGPVYVQEEVKIGKTIDRLGLYQTLAKTGANLLIDNLDNIVDGRLKPTAQDESRATYTKLITKSDGEIDWKTPAEQIEREVRAYMGWPKSRAKLKHFDVILTRVRIARNATDGELVKKCGQGWLEIQQLIAPSGRTISGAEFLRGYKI